jgi:hypothetical protein
MDRASRFFPRVKANLILQHDQDDELLLGCLAAAFGSQKAERLSLAVAVKESVLFSVAQGLAELVEKISFQIECTVVVE